LSFEVDAGLSDGNAETELMEPAVLQTILRSDMVSCVTIFPIVSSSECITVSENNDNDDDTDDGAIELYLLQIL